MGRGRGVGDIMWIRRTLLCLPWGAHRGRDMAQHEFRLEAPEVQSTPFQCITAAQAATSTAAAAATGCDVAAATSSRSNSTAAGATRGGACVAIRRSAGANGARVLPCWSSAHGHLHCHCASGSLRFKLLRVSRHIVAPVANSKALALACYPRTVRLWI